MMSSSIRAMCSTLDRFLSDERAATSIEYALIASGISVAIVGIVGGIGTNVRTMFNTVSTALK
jgi:pilus assembly protein Flp/PilA